MNLKETIKKILTEETNNSEEILKKIENSLNRFMPIEFPWWKKIKINSFDVDISPRNRKVIIKNGELNVDRDWAAEQWGAFYVFTKFPEYEESNEYDEYVALGDIIANEDSSIIIDNAITVISAALGTNIRILVGINTLKLVY